MEGRGRIKDIYPLSPMQKGMLFHSGYDQGGTYFEQSRISLKGNIDIQQLEQRFQRVVNKYDILRTVFECSYGEEPIQIVLENRQVSIEYEDLTHMEQDMQSSYINEFMEEDRKRGFLLDSDLLIRMKAFRVEVDRLELVLSFHHIILDGWSWGIVLRELFADIKQEKLQSSEVDREGTPYVKYIQWIEQQNKEEAEHFWQNYLEGFAGTGQLPAKNRSTKEIDRKEYIITSNKETMQSIGMIARKNKITISTLLQAIWGFLLYRYTSTREVLFGTVVSGRECDLERIEEMVGVFIHTLPVRLNFEKVESILEAAYQLQQTSTELYSYSYLSLSEILKYGHLETNAFDTIMAIENYPVRPDQFSTFPNCMLLDIKTFEQTNYDLTLVLLPGDQLMLNFIYNGNRYDAEFIQNLASDFLNVLDALIQKPAIKCSEIELLSKDEINQILYQFNRRPEPVTTTICKRFNEMVNKYPDKTALVFGRTRLSYRELDKRANQVAHTLMDSGVMHGDITAILVEHNIETIIGILGIIKAGSAYLPIDLHLPQERVKQMLEDGRPVAILNACDDKIPGYTDDAISLFQMESISKDTSNPNIFSQANDLAYLMYSSGTTGKPKGIAIEQRGILRLVLNADYVDFGRVSTILQTSSLVFDAATLEMWGTLLNGLTLVIASKETILETDKLADFIRNNDVDTMWLTSSLFNQIAQENEEVFETIRILLVGGDVVSPKNVSKIQKQNPNIQIINGYGPTENTTFSVCYNIERRHYENIPIGHPINGSTAYIFDQEMHLAPVGAVGELYVGGEGLAREYLNSPELNKEKFCMNPYVMGERLYRTGDLARWLLDGSIEFLGRFDNQVKIRGYRIELNEIENAFRSMESIQNVAVTTILDELGNKNICAYLVTRTTVTVDELKQELKRTLADYMIPTHYVFLDKIPLTTNGKVDWGALSQLETVSVTQNDYAKPSDLMEEELAKLWQQVLGIKRIGVLEDFFTLGGDSIKAIQAVTKGKKSNLVFSVKDLFECRTIQALKSRVRSITTHIEQGLVEGRVILTPIQRWLLQDNKDVNQFNQAIMLHSRKAVDVDCLKKAFVAVLQHHDALRMQYEWKKDSWHQRIRGMSEEVLDFKVLDMRSDSDVTECIRREAEKIQESMNISEGALVKVAVFQTADGDHILIAIHHLVVDGVSWRILLEDICSAYKHAVENKKIALPSKTNSLKDWALALTTYANERMQESERVYWRNTEEALKKVPKIPKDYVITYRPQETVLELESMLTVKQTEQLLTTAHQRYGTRMNDLLVAALVISLSEWSKQHVIAINMEGHGREDIIPGMDISRTVGWFTSMYPLAIQLPNTSDLGGIIKLVKECNRRLPNNGIGYGIMKYLTEEGIFMDSIPEISFNYLGQFESNYEAEFITSTMPIGNCIGKQYHRPFAIDINCKVENGTFKVYLAYSRLEYREETIWKLLNSYIDCLSSIITHCQKEAPKEYTPSDFGNDQMDIEELDDLFQMLESM